MASETELAQIQSKEIVAKQLKNKNACKNFTNKLFDPKKPKELS